MNRTRAALVLALVAGGCSTRRSDSAPAPVGVAPVDFADASAPLLRVVMDPIERPASCTLGHQGLLLDLGERAARSELALREPTIAVERDGASWERALSRTLSLRFVPLSTGFGAAPSDAGRPELSIDSRIRSLTAKSATVYLDGKAVGTWPLVKGETRVVSARSTSVALPSAPAHLMIRFNGVPKSSTEPVAEIDWIRIGASPIEASYSAPTRADALVAQTVAGVAKRALSVPTPGFLRCVGVLPKGATAHLSAAVAGRGEAEVVVRIARDHAPSIELGRLRATAQTWQPLVVAIPDEAAGSAIGLEVEVTNASRSARVLLADVRVVAPPASMPSKLQGARNAVVVVLGDTPPSMLSLGGGPLASPSLEAFAKRGVVFERHRATTTWAAGSVGSLITGLMPPQHGAEDDALRLADAPLTLARAARDAGIQAAMFSANPTTSAAYGFDRDWVDFESLLPSPDQPAARVFDDAAAWIDKHKAERFLVLVHARGGHPPWDVAGDALKTLPPEGYSGPIDPRHAGEVLAKARRVPPLVRFSEADRIRSMALFAVAVAEHDAALGRLLRALSDAGHQDDTAVFVTGDVGVSGAARVPFSDDGTLDEAALSIPLVVRHPGAPALAGTRSLAPTSSMDLARSVVASLGLAPPQAFGGADVLALAASPDDRMLVATSARQRASLRLGSLVLSGSVERAAICNFDVDPACASDVSRDYPLTDALLRARAAEVAQAPAVRSGYVAPDAALTAALRIWGR